MTKERLDQLLVDKGLAPSRTKAQALIMAGSVFHGTQRLDKPGVMVDSRTELTLATPEHPWVSRGGVKLAHAIKHFAIRVRGKVAADIGASTGGFTDVLLHEAAAKVYAVDVGHGQLDSKLRKHPKVTVLEHTNARYLTREQIPDALDLVVCDASFISLKIVLPAALALCKPQAALVALIKPQFEVGKGKVGKGGVVRDSGLHKQVCDDITEWLSAQAGWSVVGVAQSPITGPKGNVEFLLYAIRA